MLPVSELEWIIHNYFEPHGSEPRAKVDAAALARHIVTETFKTFRRENAPNATLLAAAVNVLDGELRAGRAFRLSHSRGDVCVSDGSRSIMFYGHRLDATLIDVAEATA